MWSSSPAIRLLTEVKLRLSSHTLRFGRFQLLFPSLKSHKNHEQNSSEWLGALPSSNDFGSLVRLKPSHLLLFPHLSGSIEPPPPHPPNPEIAHLTLAWWICKKTRWFNKFHGWSKHWLEGLRWWQKGVTYTSDGRVYVQLLQTAPRLLFPEFLLFIFRNDISAGGFILQLKSVDRLLIFAPSAQIFTVASIFET